MKRVPRTSPADEPQVVDVMAAEAALVRFVIIQLLYEQADWLAERVIRKTLDNVTELRDGVLGRHLGYLERKELIESQRRKVNRAKFDFYRITPDGIDVYEGTTTVPGVGRRQE